MKDKIICLGDDKIKTMIYDAFLPDRRAPVN